MYQTDMTPSRLEAFSDGVIAIVITIMVLELKVPHAETPAALFKLWPIFISYALSFLMVAVYWVNHHHLFHMVKHVNSRILWSNIFLLFCISLIPFFTAYMNEHHMNGFSVMLYSGILLVCACAYRVLSVTMSGQFKEDDNLRKMDKAATRKNWIAMGLYLLAMVLAYSAPAISLTLCFIVGCMYLVPGCLGKKHP